MHGRARRACSQLQRNLVDGDGVVHLGFRGPEYVIGCRRFAYRELVEIERAEAQAFFQRAGGLLAKALAAPVTRREQLRQARFAHAAGVANLPAVAVVAIGDQRKQTFPSVFMHVHACI